MMQTKILFFTFLAAVFSGCASNDIKKGTYDALQTRQCIVDTGNPNCDPEKPSYEEYKQERDKIIEKSVANPGRE